MKKIYFIFSILLMLPLVALDFYVDSADPVYNYLDRQATRGICRDFFNDSRPLLRNDIARWLLVVKENESRLTRIDREILADYLVEYRPEVSDQYHPDLGDTTDFKFGLSSFSVLGKDLGDIVTKDLDEEAQHVYTFENDKTTIWADVDMMFRVEGKNTALRFVDQLGGTAGIQAGDHLAFYMDAYIFHQYMNTNYPEMAPEFNGQWLNTHEYAHFATFDRSEAYANVSGDFGTLTIAHYPFVWGNSLNSMILSEEATTFGSVQWTKEFKHFKYTFLHGNLLTDSYTLTEDGRYYVPKYLVAHRLETHIGSRLHVNLSEMICYGDRNPEVSYLVPLILLWPTEHALGDRDNKMVALEAELFPVNGLKLFGTAFLDELSPTKIFKDWWANKFGLQAGFHWAPASVPADLIVEATAVHPWTYTHKYSFGNYTHHGNDLGFYAGPNSQLLATELRWDVSRKSKLSLKYSHLLEGSDSLEVNGVMYPVGGDASQNYEKMSPALEFATTWLMGDLTVSDELRLEWLYRFRRQFYIKSHLALQKRQEDVNLYYGVQFNIAY